jgi:hypothetical protein
MAQDVTETDIGGVPLFNSPLETGVRAVIVLDATFPRCFDLAHLTWFDHLVVHTGDIGGPASLHPDIPQRTGELLVRRRLVDEGLNLTRRVHLVDAHITEHGIVYQAREEASAFTESLRSVCAPGLKERASWLADYLSRISDAEIEVLIARRIDRWAVELRVPREWHNNKQTHLYGEHTRGGMGLLPRPQRAIRRLEYWQILRRQDS